jgi:hypothetical protein
MYERRRDNEMDLYRYTDARILGYYVAMATKKNERRIIASKPFAVLHGFCSSFIRGSHIYTGNL